MSETLPSLDNALPIVKNASTIRLKLLAMQLQETLDVLPSDLPKSYKSPQPLIANIQKHYGFYYGLLRMSSGPGWKVIRVSTKEEASNYVPRRRSGVSNTPDEPVRTYHMSDSELVELVIEKIGFGRRDIALLTPRGITSAWLDTLESDNLAFGELPNDEYWQAKESEATEIKDGARTTLENRLNNLRNMADNAFGSGSVTYRAFRFEGLVSEEDARLPRLARRAWREGTLNQAALNAWGGTVAFLNQLKADIDDFEEKMDDLETTKTDRLKATVQRITTGNDIYSRLDTLCSTGKDVFRTISQAKYNDYLIYKAS